MVHGRASPVEGQHQAALFEEPSQLCPTSTHASTPYPSVPEECTIGDSDDDDEELVQIRRTNTKNRMKQQKSPEVLRRALIPFHWAPMLSPLIPADLDACVALEHAVLPDRNQSCSIDQIEYYIRKCGGISLGLFNTCPSNETNNWQIRTLPHARPVETGRTDGSKTVLFAHILATLGKHPVVTDDDLQYPHNWREVQSAESPLGHQISGRTMCLHSFSVCPEVQGVGIGKSAMKAYVQLMNQSGMADRVALICKESLVSFFSNVGFTSAGKSQTTMVGSGWHNMVGLPRTSYVKSWRKSYRVLVQTIDLPGPHVPLRLN